MFSMEKGTACTGERRWQTAGATLKKTLSPLTLLGGQLRASYRAYKSWDYREWEEEQEPKLQLFSSFRIFILLFKKKKKASTHPGPKDKTGSYRIHKLVFIILHRLNSSKAARTPNMDLLTRDCQGKVGHLHMTDTQYPTLRAEGGSVRWGNRDESNQDGQTPQNLHWSPSALRIRSKALAMGTCPSLSLTGVG